MTENALGDGNKTVTQIALVVKNIEEKSAIFAELFGVEKPEWFITEKGKDTFYNGQPTDAQAKLAFFHMENITIELIEPVGGPSTWRDALEQNGDSLHHIAFNVKGMETVIGNLTKLGIPLIQRGGDPENGGGYAYCDGEKKLGLVLELLEGY